MTTLNYIFNSKQNPFACKQLFLWQTWHFPSAWKTHGSEAEDAPAGQRYKENGFTSTVELPLMWSLMSNQRDSDCSSCQVSVLQTACDMDYGELIPLKLQEQEGLISSTHSSPACLRFLSSRFILSFVFISVAVLTSIKTTTWKQSQTPPSFHQRIQSLALFRNSMEATKNENQRTRWRL